MDIEFKINTLFDRLLFKTNYSDFEESSLLANQSKAFYIYMEEMFPKTFILLKEANLIIAYLVPKINQFIDLEYKYSSAGYPSRGPSELANKEVIEKIHNDLEVIEKNLIKHKESLKDFKLFPIIIDESTISFKSEKERFINKNAFSDAYDLDQNFYIESKAK